MATTIDHGKMTVGELRRVLEGFDDDATVVVSTGIGYEEPKVELRQVRPVLVPQRYLSDHPNGSTVVALVGVN